MKYSILSITLFAVLALGACKGEQGATGKTGATGIQGDTGAEGKTGSEGSTVIVVPENQ